MRGSVGFMGEDGMKSNCYSEFGDGERGNGGIKERKKINKVQNGGRTWWRRVEKWSRLHCPLSV